MEVEVREMSRRRKTLILFAVAAVGASLLQPAAAQTPLARSQNVEYLTGDHGATGGHVMVEGDRLYVGAYGLGMRFFDISDPEAPELIGSYMPGLRADAVPDAARFGKRHIAVLNGTRRHQSTLQSEFLDVTDPANPELLWRFEGPEDGEAHNGDIVDKRKLWLPSGGIGPQGLRIYDLKPLLGKEPKEPKNLFRADPAELWKASPFFNGDDTAFTHTHDITVYTDYRMRNPRGSGNVKRDIALLAEGGAYADNAGNTGSVFIIDITNPRNPMVLNRWRLGEDEGHPIRYYHEAQFLDSDPRLMIVADEDLHSGCGISGGLYAVRVSEDLTKATALSEWFAPPTTVGPVCSAHVFDSKGSRVFMGTYNAGLQVIDYKNPREPEQVGYFIAEGSTAWGAWFHEKNIVYIGDMSRGLDVVRWSPE